MRVTEIRRWWKAQPFQPFRVFISDGASYDVPHPDFLFVTHTRIEIGICPDSDEIPETLVSCDPIHITRIEPLTNGTSTRSRKTRKRKK